MKYDCVLIFKGAPSEKMCRQKVRDNLPDYYIGYFLKLGSPSVSCTVRKTHDRPPTSADRYHRKDAFKNSKYIKNILSYLHSYKDRRAGDPPPIINMDGFIFKLHEIQTKKGIDNFLEDADIHTVLCVLENGGI